MSYGILCAIYMSMVVEVRIIFICYKHVYFLIRYILFVYYSCLLLDFVGCRRLTVLYVTDHLSFVRRCAYILLVIIASTVWLYFFVINSKGGRGYCGRSVSTSLSRRG